MGERYPAPESGGVARCWQTHDTTGNYVPSSSEWVHDQVEVYERSGGREGNEIMGRPIVVVTSRGAKSGNLRKNPASAPDPSR